MPKLSRIALAAASVMIVGLLPASALAASRTLELTLAADGSGQLRGSERCTAAELEKLKPLKDAGAAVLSDCLMDAQSMRAFLKRSGLAVREVNSVIRGDVYELTWQAAFSELPRAFGPLGEMSLAPSTTDPGFLDFRARLGTPAGQPVPPDSPLRALTVTVRLEFVGTAGFPAGARAPAGLSAEIEHTGEAARWTTTAADLASGSFDLALQIAPQRASETRYWLVLMIGLTVLTVAVAVGILRRGLRKT